MDFELNLTLAELEDRVSAERLKVIDMLDDTDSCYSDLGVDDKKVLRHLVRAGEHFERIYYRMKNEDNLPFLDYLNRNLASRAHELTRVLFLAQKDITAFDMEGATITLAKGDYDLPGLGFYPKDLSTDEFYSIISTMLDRNLVDDVRMILSNRSMVFRDGKLLKGIDYIEYFRADLDLVIEELESAKKHCNDIEFCKYLDLQILALRYPDPMLDAYADVKWAKLDSTIFEFTITRESYDDHMTTSLLEHSDIKKRLKDIGIDIIPKDLVGVRVGLVNKKGTDLIHRLSTLNSIAIKHMPYRSEYKSARDESKSTQTVADVDLIALFGDTGAYSGGVTLAENLPNDDKLSHTIGGGNRNVYHRQVRLSGKGGKYIGYLSDKLHKYYDVEADHIATICHENTHSLGPDSTTLGKYSHIIEELKADMGMFAFSNEYIESGIFTKSLVQKMVVTIVTNNFLKNKPKLEQAHRVRQVMYTNRFLEEKAIYFDDKNKLIIDYEKVIEVSKIILKEVIRLQIDSSPTLAKEYIDRYFVWNDTLKMVAEDIKNNMKTLNGRLHEPLKDKLLSKTYRIK